MNAKETILKTKKKPKQQNKTKKPKFEVAKVATNRASLLIPVSFLMFYLKTFYASHLLNL